MINFASAMVQENSSDCPFCQSEILKGMFDETDNFIAIYNAAPILPGHSLIIPRRHVASVLDLSEDELFEMVVFSRDTAKRLLRVFKATAFNWTVQDGAPAGQTVPHLHLHLIPRTEADLPSPGDWYPQLKRQQSELIDSDERIRLTDEQLESIATRIRSESP